MRAERTSRALDSRTICDYLVSVARMERVETEMSFMESVLSHSSDTPFVS